MQYLISFIISMFPIVELRGGIPYAFAQGLEWYYAFALCALGNLLPIPFILLFIPKVIAWFKKTKCFYKLGVWLEKKAEKNTGKVQKFKIIGLTLFVAIPLPMTGAWTGALVAAMTQMKFKHSFPCIVIGVFIAATIVTLICTGVLSALNWLL